jgi:hypothetical protein
VSGASWTSFNGPGADSRAERFRRTHREGQTVRGSLLRQGADGLAWVRIDGQELLASVAGEHTPGRELFFRVERLQPDIVLKQLRGVRGASGAPLAAIRLQAEVARFEALLDAALLDGALPGGSALGAGESDASGDSSGGLVQGPGAAPDDATARRAAFLALVAARPELLRAYAALLAREREINTRLAQTLAARYAYAPWLVPGARGVEVLFLRAPGAGEGSDPEAAASAAAASGAAPAGLAEIRLGCTLAPLGRLELRILHRDGEARCRVLLEDAAARLRDPLDAVLGRLCAAALGAAQAAASGPEGAGGPAASALDPAPRLIFLGTGRLATGPAGVLSGVLPPDGPGEAADGPAGLYRGIDRRV